MENHSLKDRLSQNLKKQSGKLPTLDKDQQILVPVFKSKLATESNDPISKLNPIYKQGRLVLAPKQIEPEPIKISKPNQIVLEKLSVEARNMLEDGRSKTKANLKPNDIFKFYQNFPEMMEDFFYLNRVSHPYDYQVVSYSHRNQNEYMTISSQGLTLYHDKEAEFMNQQMWAADSKKYYQLQKISFFRQYKLSKNFRIWKNKMRRHYMKEMSGILNQQLFLTLKHPRESLLAIHSLALSLKDSLEIFPLDPTQSLNSADFQDSMEAYRKTISRSLEAMTAQTIEFLNKAISQEINLFKKENNIQIEAIDDTRHNKEGFAYSQEALLKKKYKQIAKLIKLVDHILFQTKNQWIKKSVENLSQKLQHSKIENLKDPWIICTGILTKVDSKNNDYQMKWEPSQDEFISLFIETIKTNLSVLSSLHKRLMWLPEFRKFNVSPGQEVKGEQSRTIKMLVQNSQDFNQSLVVIEESLRKEYESVGEQESSLSPYLQIYSRHSQLHSFTDLFSNFTAVELTNIIEKWRDDQKKMIELTNKKSKLIEFDLSELKKKITQSPKTTLQNFFSMLPSQTLEKCKRIIGECKQLLDSIQAYPTEILNFIEFNKNVKKASDALPELKNQSAEICLLVDIISKNKMLNLEFYAIKKGEVISSIATLKSKVEESEAKQNENISRFKKNNEVEVTKLKSTCKEIKSKFSEILCSSEQVESKGHHEDNLSEMRRKLQQIDEILPMIEGLEKHSTKLHEIECELSLPMTNFTEIHQLYQNIQLVHESWSCRDQWKSFLHDLIKKHYCDFDSTEVRNAWQLFYSQVLTLSKKQTGSQLLKRLLCQINEFETLLDTVCAFRSHILDEKSWIEISEYLAYEMDCQDEELPFANRKNPAYTLQWMLNNHITLYKEKIQFIVNKSQKEKEISAKLAQFKSFLSTLCFDLELKKRQVVVLGSNESLKETMMENLWAMQEVVNGEYSVAIKSEAEVMIKQYEYVSEIIHHLVEFTTYWTNYESFFDPNNNSIKVLTKEAKEFNNWELQWKKIVKTITAEPTYFYKKVCDETLGAQCSKSMLKQIAKTNVIIEQIRKGLDEYLDRKRMAFPRYCLFSDELLLKMFSQTDHREPLTANFVPIIYPSLSSIVYKQDTKDTLLSVISKEGEEFPLKPANFKLQSEMEDIFRLCEEQIKKKMSHLIKTIFAKYSEEEITRQTMISQNNCQAVLAIDYIAWVRLAEETYLCQDPLGELSHWLTIQNQQISENVALLKQSQPLYCKLKLLQLMNQSLFFREKTEFLQQHEIKSTDAFEWEMTPKLFLSNVAPEIYLRQMNSKIIYCYELLLNSQVSFVGMETEKVWLNLSEAIAQKQKQKDLVILSGSQDYRIETIKQLGYIVGQNVETVDFGSKFTYRYVERYFMAVASIGCWSIIDFPLNPEMLSFVSFQISNAYKNLQQNTNQTSIKMNSGTASSTCFFLNMIKSCERPMEISQKERKIVFMSPDFNKILSMLGAIEGYPVTLGARFVEINHMIQQLLKDNYYVAWNGSFIRRMFQQLMKLLPQLKYSQDEEEKFQIDLAIFEVLDSHLLVKLSREDSKLYEAAKTSILPDYFKIIKRKAPRKVDEWKQKMKQFCYKLSPCAMTKDQLNLFSQCYDAVENEEKMGVIIVGEPISGKSRLISETKKIAEFMNSSLISTTTIYPQAYSAQKIYHQVASKKMGLLSTFFTQEHSNKWVILDGKIDSNYLEFFSGAAQRVLVPHQGEFQKKWKLIVETTDLCNVSPSIMCNHDVVHVNSDLFTTEDLVKSFLKSENIKILLRKLAPESIDYLQTILSSAVSKFEVKGFFKGKLITLIYSISTHEITRKCLDLLNCILLMNCESIREKDKTTSNKNLDKLLAWVLFWSIAPITMTEDLNKLEKCLHEVCKTENQFSSELSNFIIYPNCGLDVQLIAGQRTQTTMNIPEAGLITNLLRSEMMESDVLRGNSKFYEEIIISEPHLIRVNTNKSNQYSYFTQIYAKCHFAMILHGPPSSGKKSISDLFVKNLKSKWQIHSIRFDNQKQYCLLKMLEKPFSKHMGLDGNVMKPTLTNRQLLVSIEDICLTSRDEDSREALRMIFNQGAYFNDLGEKVTLTNTHFQLINHRFTNCKEVTRLFPNLKFLQSSSNEVETIGSIYLPYLKSWSSYNGLTGQVERLFASENGDNLLDATISMYQFCSDSFAKSAEKTSIESLTLRPRIGDIAKILAYICKTPDAKNYSLQYFYELWTHEVLRVFGDRISSPTVFQALLKEIKKESLLKFKENFTHSDSQLFVFTSLGLENQNCYIKIEDISYLENYINSLIEEDSISLYIKFLFKELLENVIKIYRICVSEDAHMMLLSHNRQTALYFTQMACQIGEIQFYGLNQLPILPEKHIEPTIFYRDSVCLFESVSQMTPTQSYQMECFLNRNYYQLEHTQELKDKIKSSLLKKDKSESQDAKKDSKYAPSKDPKFSGASSREEDEWEQAAIQNFMSFGHFILWADPSSKQVRQFLHQQVDIVGLFHFNWMSIPSEAIKKNSKEILLFDENEQAILKTSTSKWALDKKFDEIIAKNYKIYESLALSDQYFNNFLFSCEMIKKQRSVLSSKYEQELKVVSMLREEQIKYTQCFERENASLKVQQEELEVLSNSIEQSMSALEKLDANISQMQILSHSEQSDDQLVELRLRKEQTEVEVKRMKEKKDKELEPQKKKTIKNLLINRESLDILEKKEETLNKMSEDASAGLREMEDLLMICWGLILYTPHCTFILKQVHQWIAVIQSPLIIDTLASFWHKIKTICKNQLAYEWIEENGIDETTKIKLLLLTHLLENYQDSINYSRVLQIADPLEILPGCLQEMSDAFYSSPVLSNCEGCLTLLRYYPNFKKENCFEMESLCRKPGFILVKVESQRESEELEWYFRNKKQDDLLWKIIVISSGHGCDFEFEANHETASKLLSQTIAREEFGFEYACGKASKKKYLENVASLQKQRDVFRSKLLELQSKCDQEFLLEEIKRHFSELQATKLEIANYKENKQSYPNVEALLHILDQQLKQITPQHLNTHFPTILHFYHHFRQTLREKGLYPLDSPSNQDQQLQPSISISRKQQAEDVCCQMFKANFTTTFNFRQFNLPSFLELYQFTQSTTLLITCTPSLQEQFIKANSFETAQHIDLFESSTASDTENRLKKLKIISNFVSQIHHCKMEEILLKWQADTEIKRIVILFGCFQPSSFPSIKHVRVVSDSAQQKQLIPESVQPLDNRTIQSFSEELPFLFNIAEFNSSKDLLGAEVTKRCVKLNAKIKKIKDKLKEYIIDCNGVDKPSMEVYKMPSETTIFELNTEYNILKKCLLKLQMINPQSISSNYRIRSAKNLTQTNFNLASVLKWSDLPITSHILSILKIKASRKFKVHLSNIQLDWKICTESFNFEENQTLIDLCMILEGEVRCKSEENSNKCEKPVESENQKIYLIICPVVNPLKIEKCGESMIVCDENGEELGRVKGRRNEKDELILVQSQVKSELN